MVEAHCILEAEVKFMSLQFFLRYPENTQLVRIALEAEQPLWRSLSKTSFLLLSFLRVLS